MAPDPVYLSSRREALAAFLTWFVAMLWTVGVSCTYGYGRDPATLTYVLGFPDWVFYGVVLPWCVCFLLSYGFSAVWVKDEDLGSDQDEGLED